MHQDDYAHLADILHGDQRGDLEEERQLEFRLKAADGSWRIIQCREAAYDRAEDGRVIEILGVLIDLSVRRQLENHIETLEHSAVDSRVEYDKLLRLTTQDMRRPLVNANRFCGELDHAFSRISNNIEVNDHDVQRISGILDDMRSNISRVNLLIDGIAQIARLEESPVEIEDIDMNELVRRLIESSGFTYEQCGFEIEVDELPPCRADRSRITQAFYNLIENAVTYLAPSREPVISLTGWENEDESVYCVEDNGIGIAEKDFDEVFAMFGRIRQAPGTGKGVGLAIVKKIVEGHQGRIALESTPNQGSKFYISLPRT